MPFDQPCRAAGAAREPQRVRRLVERVGLDFSLLDEEWLHGGTGLDHIEFFYLAACFEDAVRKNPDSTLFRSGADPGRASARGNRCSLAAEHMLAMLPHHVWTNCAQEAPQMPFKVDRTTASRNIGTVRGILAGTTILPTGIVMMDEVRSLSPVDI